MAFTIWMESDSNGDMEDWEPLKVHPISRTPFLPTCAIMSSSDTRMIILHDKIIELNHQIATFLMHS